MTLTEKLENIAKTSTVKSLTEYPDVETVKDFDELWEKVIEPNLPDKNAVIRWHNLLMQYIQQDNAVFTLRCYPGRRGFLNKVFVQSKESFETFYTDNSVPFYLYSMAKDGFVPNIAEFNDAMINNRTFPCSYFPSKGAYPQGKNHRINTKGYKLAHIFSTGENYDKNAGYTSITNFCEAEFPNTDITKWNSVLPNGKHYRRIDIDDHQKAETVRAFAVAHFLRSVHPLNYFLVPMTTGIEYKKSKIKKTNIYWYDYDKDEPGKDIGEYLPLIEYVAAKIKELYKDTNIYEEFLHLIFPIGNCINPKGDNVRIDAEYAIDIWKRNIGSALMPVKGSKATNRAVKSTSNKRDNSKYSFNGRAYRKAPLVVALVDKYLEDNPNTDFAELSHVFDLILVYNRKSIILLPKYATDSLKSDDTKRTLSDGTSIYINKQAQIGDMKAIINIANNLGYKVDVV